MIARQMRWLALVAALAPACSMSDPPGGTPTAPSSPADTRPVVGPADGLSHPANSTVPDDSGQTATQFDAWVSQVPVFAHSLPTTLVRFEPAGGVLALPSTAANGLPVAAPNAPLNVRGAYTGAPGPVARLQLTWDPPSGGEAPTTYIVIYQGRAYDVGRVTSASAVVSVGEYFISVLARNSAGDSSRNSVFVRVGDVPNRPIGLGRNLNGTSLQLFWQSGGGWPASEYVVLFQGQRYSMGSATTTPVVNVAPGSYLIAVLARNALGDSAAATIDVTVSATIGTYAGRFRGSGTITRWFSNGVCSWQMIYAGNITVTTRPSPFGGTVRVSGTWSASNGTSSTLRCVDGSGSYDNTGAISGTASSFTAAVDMSIAAGSFSGSVVGSTVSGSLTARYRNGPGTTTMPVNLAGS